MAWGRCWLCCAALVVSLLASTGRAMHRLEERQHWWDLGKMELAAALNVRQNWNVAKNIIFFLGDGMGITANTAARIYKGQKKGMHGEEGYLAWERFPNTALLKTYNVDRQVPDSAATATAFLCGVKSNYYTLGVDSGVKLGDCAGSQDPEARTPSLLQWAQDAGKDTGVVTTTRVTHATPAATYAFAAHRNWECDGNLGKKGEGCNDIAHQLIHDSPGNNIKVVLGGGRQVFGAGLAPPKDKFTCKRKDGRNLTQEWLEDKKERGVSGLYVTTAGQMHAAQPDHTEYLLGLFADSHMPYEVERLVGSAGVPSLKDMTLKALQFLQKNEDGYFLLVEGGRIDHALHDNLPHRALEEAVALDAAVSAVLEMVDLEETLVVVTADHSHVMTINGYPHRGNDILGLVEEPSKVDQLQYTTLMFTNGPGYNYSVNGSKVVRHNPKLVNTKHIDYRSQAAVPMPPISETHGGEDVAIWAAGPMSHLFHRTHEQHYVAHAVAYSACIGPSLDKCARPPHAHIDHVSDSEPVRAESENPQFPPSKNPHFPPRHNPRFPPSHITHNEETDSREPKLMQDNSKGPKFPTLFPVLQQLLDDNQQKIVTALGTESVKSFSSSSDVRQLLGKSVLPPHSM